jgi:hypothetical protein
VVGEVLELFSPSPTPWPTPLPSVLPFIRFGVDSTIVFSMAKGADPLAILNLSGLVRIPEVPTLCHIRPDGPVPAPIERTTDGPNAELSKYARWTFLYRKFGSLERHVEVILAMRIDLRDQTEGNLSTIETVFTELTEDGTGAAQPVMDEEYKATLSIVFDALFQRLEGDAIRRIGVLWTLGFLATIWVYFVIFFDED